MKNFFKDRCGNFAVITALAAVPLVGMVGIAVDYSRALNVRTAFQDAGDAAALAVAAKGPAANDTVFLNKIVSLLRDRYETTGMVTHLRVENAWSTPTDYRVKVTADLPVSLSSVLPGVPDTMAVSAVSIARYKEATYLYKAPEVAQLDPEAGDYNRVAVYCYNSTQKSDPATHGRTQITDIADNGGTKYNDTKMPQCGSGEVMSYRLYNVRDARGNKNKWDDKNAEQYDYYTDTTPLTGGGEQYDLSGKNILETVLCPTLQACQPKSKGGIIPEGKNRTPQHASWACSNGETTCSCPPGQFLYYGWEDRPVGDKDFDDIRVIIGCPDVTQTSSQTVRLVE